MSKGPYTPAPSYRTNHIQKYVNHRSAYDLSTTSDIADISLGGRRVNCPNLKDWGLSLPEQSFGVTLG